MQGAEEEEVVLPGQAGIMIVTEIQRMIQTLEEPSRKIPELLYSGDETCIPYILYCVEYIFLKLMRREMCLQLLSSR